MKINSLSCSLFFYYINNMLVRTTNSSRKRSLAESDDSDCKDYPNTSLFFSQDENNIIADKKICETSEEDLFDLEEDNDSIFLTSKNSNNHNEAIEKLLLNKIDKYNDKDILFKYSGNLDNSFKNNISDSFYTFNTFYVKYKCYCNDFGQNLSIFFDDKYFTFSEKL